jgi:tetratricopeptide (TPR) repeat protein
VAYIQRYDAQPALDAFIDVLVTILDSDVRSDATRRVGELTVLNMARTFYSAGQFEQAIDYYDQVPASSVYWLDALFEKAWALYQLREDNRALGNLHSLNSPFFDDQFYPEGRYLQSVIFFRNCNYDAVRLSVEEFEIDYGPIQDQLDDMLASLASDEAYHDLIVSLQGAQERDFSAQLQQIVNTAVDNTVAEDVFAFVQELDREMRQINMADPGWVSTGLVDELLAETGLARSVAAGRAGEYVRIRIVRARDELQRLMNDSMAILVETDLAEQAVIDDRFRDELNLGDDAGLMPPERDDEHLLWHFAGEYWRDELGYYWYAIGSRCSEVVF